MILSRPLALCTFSLLLAASPVGAGKPGDATVEEPDKESGDQRIEIFDNNKAETVCKTKGKICLRAASGTEATGSEAAPVFKRSGGAKKGDWVVDVYGNFKKPALAGNAQFIFVDAIDAKTAKTRDPVGVYQSPVKAGGTVSARVRLSTEEGFRAGRPYKALIAQIIAGKEVILAEGDFQLQ